MRLSLENLRTVTSPNEINAPLAGQRSCANCCQCCLFFLIALGSLVGILCATLRSENKLWLGLDRLTVKGDWAEAAALTAGEGCSSSKPGSTCLSNQSGLVCMQIDSYTSDHAQINDLLPDRTFTAANFSGDRDVDAWRFGNATVACMTCLADTGDPARKIRGSGCELECGLVCRGHFANGDNICTGEDYTREDLWIYSTVYGLNLLALVLLPVLASMLPLSIIRWLFFRLSLPLSVRVASRCPAAHSPSRPPLSPGAAHPALAVTSLLFPRAARLVHLHKDLRLLLMVRHGGSLLHKHGRVVLGVLVDHRVQHVDHYLRQGKAGDDAREGQAVRRPGGDAR